MTLITHGQHLHLTPEAQQRAAETLSKLADEPVSVRTKTGAELPAEIDEIVQRVLQAVAQGHEISVSTLPDFVSPNTAAAMLSVSRPTVMKYIDQGRLQAHTVGTHFKLSSAEVLMLRDELQDEGLKAVFELMKLEAELEDQHERLKASDGVE